MNEKLHHFLLLKMYAVHSSIEKEQSKQVNERLSTWCSLSLRTHFQLWCAGQSKQETTLSGSFELNS